MERHMPEIGQTLTITTKGKVAQGQDYIVISVYDKQ
jgi:hypothetical protein